MGTISIEKSERLSILLKKRGVPHNVLNAKHHEREAEIIAQAGRLGAVTISTNMAGRGTDILLGGNPKFLAKTMVSGEKPIGGDAESLRKAYQKALGIVQKEKEKVIQLGGLHVLGTERHESRRIDNQLRGRAGRQGDPGSSRFYLSLEDDLLRIFGSERISSIMDRLGIEEEQPIEHGLVSKAIENAQRRVEAHNFEIRKHLLEYDDVMNKQREVIYSQRREVLAGDDLKNSVTEMVEEQAEGIVDPFADEKVHPEDWDLKGLQDALYQQFPFRWTIPSMEEDGFKRERLKRDGHREGEGGLQEKEEEFGEATLRYLEKVIMLQSIDYHWKDHLLGCRSAEGRDRVEGVRSKEPFDRIPERSLPDVHGDAGYDQAGHGGETLRHPDCQGTRGPGDEDGAETDLRPEPWEKSPQAGGETENGKG